MTVDVVRAGCVDRTPAGSKSEAIGDPRPDPGGRADIDAAPRAGPDATPGVGTRDPGATRPSDVRVGAGIASGAGRPAWPARAPGAGEGRAEGDAWPAYWRSLGYFALSRVVVAALLLGYVPLLRGFGGLGEGFDLALWLPASIAYLAAAAAFVALSRPGPLPFAVNATVQVVADLSMLSVLIHAAGGIPSGLAALLILPNAGAAILLGTRLASFFAATSTVLLLLDATVRPLIGETGEPMLLPAAMIGASLLVTVLIVSRLARRLATQERLAWRRGEDLRNQLAVTQAVISELQDGVIVLGDTGELLASNRSAREMLGAGGDVPSPLPGLVPLRAALGVRSPSLAAVDPSHALNVPTADAVEFAVPGVAGAPGRRLRARRLPAPPGVSDAVIVLEDLGRLEERAQQLKLVAMGRLSASIAHEVRNPLAAIRHANGLLAEVVGDGRHRRLAAIVEDNCVRINRIIEDVLSISRRGGTAPEALPAARFIGQTVAEYLAQSDADPLRVECRLTSEAPIWFDAGQLRQVLLNLLGNALRHASAAPGAVRIEWDGEGPGRPALVVADDGPGVPAGARAHLFEPFFTTEARGTGLGLHLARELCTANGAILRYRPPSTAPAVRSAFVVEPAPPPAPAEPPR
jgi:two-component system sensor histidine kinase PilS (NtrC family)